MADTDLLPSRGVPFRALVDSTGIAINGSSTVLQLAAKGMHAVCAVDGTGTAITGGGSLAQISAAGIRPFCAVDQNGVAQDASTADQLRARGIPPVVLLDATGVALNGSANIQALQQRGFNYFCPVDESGNATTMGAVILISNTNVFDNIAVGATVGTLSVAGGSGTYTFTLPSNPGAHFATAGTNGVNLNTATALTAGSYPVTVQAAGGVPTPVSRALSITVAQSPTLPANTVLPVISGTPMTGMTLTTTDGTWTGFPAPTFTYQWKRGGSAISGATANSYLLVSADVGTMITVTVTATNTAGNASATSAAVGPIIASAGAVYQLIAQFGSFPYSGATMTAVTDYNLVAQNGAFAYAGFAATLSTTAGAGVYTGPGDVSGWGTAYAYYGLRAYNSTKIGANCIDVSSDPYVTFGGLVTMKIGTNGYLDLSNLPAYSPIYVSKIYDQAGTQDLVNTPANRPQLVVNKVGGLPALYFNATAALSAAANATAQAQPLTVGAIICSVTAGSGNYLCDGSFAFQPLIDSLANDIGHYFGIYTQSYTSVADNTFGSIISVATTPTPSMSVNGTITPSPGGSVGTNGIGTTNKLTMGGTDGGGALVNGYIYEIIIKAGAVSPANQANLTSNQRSIGTGF